MTNPNIEDVLRFLEANPSCRKLPDDLVQATRSALTDTSVSDKKKMDGAWFPILLRAKPRWIGFFLSMVPACSERSFWLGERLADHLNKGLCPGHTRAQRRQKLRVLINSAPHVALFWTHYVLLFDTEKTRSQMWGEILRKVDMTNVKGQALLRATVGNHIAGWPKNQATTQEVAECLSHVFNKYLEQTPHVGDGLVDPTNAVFNALNLKYRYEGRQKILVALQQVNPECVTSVLTSAVTMFNTDPTFYLYLTVLIDEISEVASDVDIQSACKALEKNSMPPRLKARASAKDMLDQIDDAPKDTTPRKM